MLDCLSADAASALPLHAVTPEGLEALLAGLPPLQSGFLRASGFKAKAQEIRLLPGGEGLAGAVLGLGGDAASPHAFGGCAFGLPEGTVWRLEGQVAAENATLGWCLGAYRFRRFKQEAGRAPARLLAPATTAAAAQATAIWRGRDLINRPANDLGPAELAAAVGELAARHGATFEVIEGAALAEGFPAVLAVGQGAIAARAPRVAVLRWGFERPDAPLVALCGKGVCFDTGGLDLKPSGAMLRMKKDMGGAAVMMATAEMIMAAGLPVRLLLLVGAVENAVSGASFRPLDVIRTRKGLSVEIGNTDAEGRLVLADLLCFAAEQQPAIIIDGATLTGAARVALGPDLPALFCDDTTTADTLLRSGLATDDPLWRLPLQKNYISWLDSNVADMNNVATKPMAGAITAALFLYRFVPAGMKWVHLDIYAWNDQSRPGRPEGGEVQAARAVTHALVALFGGASNAG
jgi:leucyl aminopeptidase